VLRVTNVVVDAYCTNVNGHSSLEVLVHQKSYDMVVKMVRCT